MKDLKNIWFISLLIKLLISTFVPLSADEAYYWVWSHKIQLSYFDHPPMIAWLIYLGHFLEPFFNAVRWPSVLIGHLSLGVGILLLKDIFSSTQLRWWMLLVLFSPMLGFGSIVLTPDLPVVFFWILSLYLLKQALEQPKMTTYALLGASLGLGFCAKYHIVLFVPSLLMYLFVEKKWSLVKWKWVPLIIFFGLISCSPVLIWNFKNDFTSFKFQINHGLENQTYDPLWTLAYIIGQLILIFPTILWAASKAHVPKSLRFIIYFSWLPLVFFFLTSFKAPVEANWPIIAIPGICILASCYEKIEKWLRFYIKFWIGCLSLIVATLIIPSVRNIDPKLREPYDLKNLSELAFEYKPLYTGSYQMAASIWYFSKVPTYKLTGMSRFDFFDTLKESQPTNDHFYLLKHSYDNLPQWLTDDSWVKKEIKHFNPDYVLLEFNRL